MKVYSHRGESKYAPENTMSAYYLAYLVGSDGIETDLRKTKDDVLVLIHDKSVDRTSNYSGKVSDYTFDELLNMDFGDEYYKGEKIVKLTEFLKNFSERNVNIYIELKETGYEKLIVDTLKQYSLKNVVLISFKYNLLKKIREMDNSIKLGWLPLTEPRTVLNSEHPYRLCSVSSEVALRQNEFIFLTGMRLTTYSATHMSGAVTMCSHGLTIFSPLIPPTCLTGWKHLSAATV